MRLYSHLLLPLFLLLFSGTAALAQSKNWLISEAKGSVLIIDSRGERPAANGQAVSAGAMVRTQARSSAVLVRGREFVTLRQNAQIRIPDAARSRSIIQVIQDYGSALFNIGKQADPHFGVQTPYLAAVVKGTTFIIAVGADGATLQVTEGAVEASTADGGARDLVLPGAVAMVAAADSMRLVIEGEGRRVIDSPARPAGGPAASAPAAAPARVTPQTRKVALPERGGQRIERAIASSPGNLRGYSNGFVSGEVAVLAAAVVADNTGRGSAPPFSNPGGVGEDGKACFQRGCEPAGNGQGQGNGQSDGGGQGTGEGDANGNGNGQGNNHGDGDGDGNGGGNGNGNGNGGGNGNGNGGGNGGGNGNDNGGGQGDGNGNGGGADSNDDGDDDRGDDGDDDRDDDRDDDGDDDRDDDRDDDGDDDRDDDRDDDGDEDRDDDRDEEDRDDNGNGNGNGNGNANSGNGDHPATGTGDIIAGEGTPLGREMMLDRGFDRDVSSAERAPLRDYRRVTPDIPEPPLLP